jgi:serine/threonine-protein kinase ATR
MTSRLRLIAAAACFCLTSLAAADAPPKPLMKDFMGINGHTVQFKPDLYKPAVSVVRDYHPVEWDLGDDTAFETTFPMARNRVDWNAVYGSWKKSGFTIDASLMFESIKKDKWKDIPVNAHAYGVAFAKFFGPSGKNLVSSAEIGNEPGKFDDPSYKAMFENMAKGLRDGDPKLTIVTCAATPGKSHDYAKSLACFEGLEKLYDVINMHDYAQAEGWPTWRRSFPEDPAIPYLKEVKDVIDWRDQHAAGKPIWITEFGWDCSTKPPPKEGDFKKWVCNTDTQQAQYLVRSFMVFASMPIERAYIYFFDDNDTPQLHGSSGITRHFQPKPSFHAVAHLQKTLGEYRFARKIQEKAGEVFAYEFAHGENPQQRVWAIWSPTGSEKKGETELALEGMKVVKAEQMPLTAGEAAKVDVKEENGKIKVPLSESPVYVWLEGAK